MKKSVFANLAVLLFAALFIVTSCDDDDDFALPTITLSEELIEAKAGEEISVNVTVVAEAGLDKVVVTTLHDGTAFGTPEEFTTLTFTYTHTVSEEDVDPILSIQFTAIDNDGQEVSKDLVVDVELTMTQILLKYDWLLSDEIRESTGLSDIADAYTDDVYRFYEDGTYDKSIGAKNDGWNDLLYNYCYWNLNEDESRLIITKTGGWGTIESISDTIMITTIDHTELVGDVIYRGLDLFDPSYDPVEDYIKKFTSQPRGESFDPYGAGATDDAGPVATGCIEVTWDK